MPEAPVTRLPIPANPACKACQTAHEPSRRDALRHLAAGAVAVCGGSGATWAATAPADPPREGDWLVPVDADELTPLAAADLQPGAKQVIVWPVDPVTRKPRDGSRLNRILIVRLDAAALEPSTLARSADGVLAYSAICTHQGCDVSSWRPAEKTLLCFCHFSQFQPADGGTVVAGPAPRPLPHLQLRNDGTRLVLASGFSESPGTAT